MKFEKEWEAGFIMKNRIKSLEQSVNNKKDSWYSSFLINGGAIFFITLMGSYLIALYERMKLRSLGIPTQYVEITFFNSVEYLEELLVVFTPVFVISIILLYIFIERYFIFYKSRKNSSEIYFENSIKYKNLIVQVKAGLFTGGMSILIAATPVPYMDYLNSTFYIAGVAFLLSHFILCLAIIRDKGKYVKEGLTKYENMFRYIPYIFFVFLIIPQFLLLLIFEQYIEKPIELLIDENITVEKNNNDEHYYIKYLVTEKDGYGVWGSLSVNKEDFHNEPTQGNEIIKVKLGDSFEMKKLDSVKVKEVSFISYGSKDKSNRLERHLYLENTRSMKSLNELEEKALQSKRQLAKLL